MVKRKGKPLTEQRRYETFIKSRDATLEAILRKYLRALDRTVDYLKDRVGEIISRHHISNAELHMLKRSLTALEHRIDQLFDPVERDVTTLIYRLRGTIYGLSAYGQSEAILRAIGRETVVDLSKAAIVKQMAQPMRAGAAIEHRSWMAMERLKRKVIDAYQTGILYDDTTKDILERVLSVFPKARYTKRGPKPLKHPKLTESEDDGATAFAITGNKPSVLGTIDPELWDQMIDDYVSTEIPFYTGRQPKDEEDYYEEHGQYEWELERDVTQEFVDQVRAGEVDSANENGISDFIVIAVIDDSTDDCCIARDGMTISEIEDAVSSGELDDDCDGNTPPFHFRCRCIVSPISDDVPDVAPPDWGSFDELMKEKAGL